MNGSLITWTSFRPEKRRGGVARYMVQHRHTDHTRAHMGHRYRHVDGAHTHASSATDDVYARRFLRSTVPVHLRHQFTAMRTGIVSMAPRLYTRHLAHPPCPPLAVVSRERQPPVRFAAATVCTGSRARLYGATCESQASRRLHLGLHRERPGPRSMLNEFTLR